MKKILKTIIEKPKPLSEEQRKALLSPKKYVRIVAGAGTGKTETLTRRIAYLLLYKNVDPADIVAFTFTEKAAQSMKSRIYERVREMKGEEACARLGEMYVGTIHGYCLRILEDYYHYGDHDILNENQEMAFILREGWALGLGKGGGYSDNCRNFLKSVNVVYDELIDMEDLHEKAPDFHKHLLRYEEKLNKHRLLTFGRLIYLAVKKLQDRPEPVSNIKHLIVDEYQDINKAQQELIKIIGKRASVFVVGDPRQSIYQWRGSDESLFENFEKLFPECDRVDITKNRRSAKSIVKAANTFSDTFERGKHKHIKAVKKEEGKCFLYQADTPKDEAEWIVSQIEAYVNSGKCSYNDISILLRSVNTSAGPFLDLFREHSIPYIVGGKVGLFRRDEAQTVGRLFAWLHDEGFWTEDPWDRAKRIQGDRLFTTAMDLWEGVTGLTLGKRTKASLNTWKEHVLSGKFKNFTEIYQRLLVILGFRRLDPANRLHAAIMANLGRFNTLLTDYESSIRYGGALPDWNSALKGLCWYMNTYASGAYEEQPADDIRGIDAVQIMTIHQAKGLEWPVVFVPCLTSLRFPSSKVGRRQRWYLPRDMFDVRRYEGELDDERRLFYVAITRSKDLLCLSNFRRKQRRIAPSRFIDSVKGVFENLDEDDNLPFIELSKSHDENEIQTFSASEIIEYMRCPYFYRLRNLWNFQPGLVIPLGYGKSLHYCLRYASELIKEGEEPKEAIRRAINAGFHLPFAGGKILENMRKAAERMLTKFVEERMDDMYRIKEVESRIEFPVQRATITGKVDVIMKNENDYEARDYKTSDEVTTTAESAFQLQLYSLGLRNIGTPINSATIAYLDEAKVKPVKVTKNDIIRAREQAEAAIESISKGDFSPRTGPFCKCCDYARICRANSS